MPALETGAISSPSARNATGRCSRRSGEHIDNLQESGLRVLIAGGGAGSRDRMVRLLREHGVHAIEPVADWQASLRACRRRWRRRRCCRWSRDSFRPVSP